MACGVLCSVVCNFVLQFSNNQYLIVAHELKLKSIQAPAYFVQLLMILVMCRCGHCKNLAPHWASAATELKGKVKLGALDATAETVTASRFGVSLPFLLRS